MTLIENQGSLACVIVLKVMLQPHYTSTVKQLKRVHDYCYSNYLITDAQKFEHVII